MSSSIDVVIIGAGLSGLTAAYTILKEKPSTNLVVLEATDRIGGPVHTETLKGANGDEVWDVGSARIGSGQKEILGLIKEFGLETYPNYDQGDKHWILGDGKTKKYSGEMPPLPYRSLADIMRFFYKVDSMQKEVDLDNVMVTPKAEEWDNMTVEELKNKILWTQAAKETIDVTTIMLFGLRCDQLTVMQYLYYSATSGSSNSQGTDEMDLRIKGGAVKLANCLVEHIGKDRIKTRSKVISLEQQSTAAVVTIEGGETPYTTKCVIVACLPTDQIAFKPALSVPKLLPSASYGIQFVVTYTKSFWRDAGSCAEVTNTQGVIEMLQGRDDHPVMMLFDHTGPDGSPALMGIFGPNQVRENSSEEREQMASKFLMDVFKTGEAKNFLDYKEYIWDPCENVPPPESLKENKPSVVLANIQKPEGVVHWAGSDTAKAFAGSLSGAVEAGRRSAEEVIAKYLE